MMNLSSYHVGIDEAGRQKQVRSLPKYIIGIDEAGRGPLAGPLVVGGIRMESGIRNKELGILKGIKDSKQLTEKQREEWYKILTKHPAVKWVAIKVSSATIDKINIYQATLLGARKVHQKLAGSLPSHALLDGSLYLPKNISQETIIKGDEKVPIIAAASIIAKVTRDRIMKNLHKKYPDYRLDLHKGYGTKLHRERIAQFGSSEIHRKSFRVKLV